MPFVKAWSERLILHFNYPIENIDDLTDEEYQLVEQEVEQFKTKCMQKGGICSATNPNKFNRKRLELICEGKPVLVER